MTSKQIDGYRVPAPMLASPLAAGQTVTHFEGNPDFVMEPKLDGVRVTVRVRAGEAIGWSRPRAGAPAALRRKLPAHITDPLTLFPEGIYDGELTVAGGKSFDVLSLANESKLVLMVFDVIELLGSDLTAEPYTTRRGYLEEIFKALEFPGVQLIAVAAVSKAVVDGWMKAGGEGAVLKRITATYRPGARSTDWLKVKALHSAVLTVTGFRAGKVGPCSSIELRDDAGQTTRVSTAGLGHVMLKKITAAPQNFIGRRLAIEYTERITGGAYRHPRADHFV
jgi:ATP-dependent DNA ligase